MTHDDPRHPDNLHDKLRELMIERELMVFLTTAAESYPRLMSEFVESGGAGFVDPLDDPLGDAISAADALRFFDAPDDLPPAA